MLSPDFLYPVNPHEVEEGIVLTHDKKHHLVHRNLHRPGKLARILVTGFPEGPGQWSNGLKESTSPFFLTFDRSAQIYLGANPLSWTHTDANIVYALSHLEDGEKADVTLGSAGSYFGFRKGTLKDYFDKITRIRLVSPVLGENTVEILKPQGGRIAKTLYGMPTTEEFVYEFIMPFADAGIPIDYYLGKHDGFINVSKTAQIAGAIHSHQPHVHVHEHAFDGHMPHINSYVGILCQKS